MTRRPCATCRHIRGPETRLGVLTWTCHEMVDKDATGQTINLNIKEARRLCGGDFHGRALLKWIGERS